MDPQPIKQAVTTTQYRERSMTPGEKITLAVAATGGIAFIVSSIFSIVASVIAFRSTRAAETAAGEAKRSADAAFEGVEQSKRSADAAVEGLKHASETVTVARQQLEFARQEKDKADAPKILIGEIDRDSNGAFYVPFTMDKGLTCDIVLNVAGKYMNRYFNEDEGHFDVSMHFVPGPGMWELPNCSPGKYQELVFLAGDTRSVLLADLKVSVTCQEADEPDNPRHWVDEFDRTWFDRDASDDR